MNSEKIYPLFLEKLNNNLKSSFKEVFLEEKSNHNEDIYKLLISFETNIKRDQFVSENQDLGILYSFDIIPAISVNLSKNKIEKLEDNPLIQTIEEDQRLYLSMFSVLKTLKQNIYRKSQIVFTGKNVVIGIIDNGINNNFNTFVDSFIEPHPINALQNLEEVQFKGSEVTHGTLMANIISNQYLDRYDDIIGIAPMAKILDFNISNEQEEYFFSDILKVFELINYKNLKIDVLLIPLSTLYPSDGKDILSKACNLLAENGTIIVCPAGNFGAESYSIGSPGAAENVITIGALSNERTVAYFSGRGPTLDERQKPDLCLPGSKINIPLSEQIQVDFSGTSISAAIGAGLIALIKQYNPMLSYKDIKTVLKNSCIDLNLSPISQGNGTINLINIFKGLNCFEEPIIPYKYLVKKSIWISFIIFSLFIGTFFLFYYFQLNQFII